MTQPTRPPRRRFAGDQGALSILTVIITLVVAVFFGAIIDFEQKLEARHDANIAAEEAARAGTGQIDTGRAYAHSGALVIDRQTAIHAAERYLRTGGYTGTVTALDDRHISVRVRISRRAIFLPLIGIDTLNVQASSVADLVTGVEGPDR